MATDEKIEVQISANTKTLEDGFEKGKAEVSASSDQIAQTVQSSMSRVTQAIQEAAARAGEGFAKIGEGIKGVGEEAEALNSKINSIKEIGAAISEFVLAGLGIEKAVDYMREFGEAGEAGEEIEHTSIIIGQTVEQTSRLQNSAKMAGVNFEGLQRGINRLGVELNSADGPSKEVQNSLDELGISAEEISKADTDEKINLLADAFKKLEEKGVNPASIALQLFGQRIGAGLVPYLSRGADGIEELKRRSDELGGTWSGSMAGAAIKVAETFNAAGVASEGLGHRFATALSPVTVALTEEWTDLIAKGGGLDEALQFAANFVNGLGLAFEACWTVAREGFAALSFLNGTLFNLGETAVTVASDFAHLNFSKAKTDVAAFTKETEQKFSEMVNLAAGEEKRFQEMLDRIGDGYEGPKTPGKDPPKSSGNKSQSDSQVKDWQNQLDKMLFDQQKFGDEAKAIEEKFWKDKLAITKQGSDDYFAVMHKVYEAENQDAAKAAEEAKRNAQKAFEAQLSVYAQERSAAQAGSQQRIAIDQQELDWVKAHYPEQADAYQRILKQQTEDRQAAEKQREQIAEIEAQAEAKSAEEVLNRRGELLQQEFNENQISWRQLAAGEAELENERYQIAYDGLQKRLALAQDNLVEQAKLNAQLEELESQHQDKIQKIDQQQQKNSMALSKQVYDQTSNDFDQVVAKFLQGKESMSTAWQQFAQDFNNIIDQMVAKLVTQGLFGGGGSGAGFFGTLLNAATGTSSGGAGDGMGSSLASSLGGWAQSLGALFGGTAVGIPTASPAMGAPIVAGGRAQGGYVAPSTMYEVAENGPETLSVGGRTFLMMGASGGTVTPSVTTGTSGGGSVSVTNNFHMGGSTDTRTQSQIAASATRALQMANART